MSLFSLHTLECNYFLSDCNCNPLPLQFLPTPRKQWWFLIWIIIFCPISMFPFIIKIFLFVRWAFHDLAHVMWIFILWLHFFFSWIVVSHYSTFHFMLLFFYLTKFSVNVLLGRTRFFLYYNESAIEFSAITSTSGNR